MSRIIHYLLLNSFLFGTIIFSSSAQDLPHHLSKEESKLIPSYIRSFNNSKARISSVDPPNSKVRTMAEWEELQGLMIAWRSYPGMLREIVKASQKETTVWIVTNDSATVAQNLFNNGIDSTNVKYLIKPFNSVWIRDYGPWSVYKNDVDTLFTIDWIYNRPRFNDDKIPQFIAEKIKTPLFQLNTSPNQLVNTGGNFMTDGLGTGFASKLVLEENAINGGFGIDHSESKIDTIMKKYMGIDRYIKMETLPYDDIHHIDMHMKLLDEETLLVGQYPIGIADGPQIEANLAYVLSNFNSAFGTPYKVIRIPMPADQKGLYPDNQGNYFTYTNSSFVNKTIIVPIYNVPTDSIALSIYRKALPGYNVVGIYSNESIVANGALHCITKEIGTADPLLISHQAITSTLDTNRTNFVKALIKHKSGIKQASVFYRTDTISSYKKINLTKGNEPSDVWTATLPKISRKKVQYYLEAEANSGKKQVRPLPAPKAIWEFQIGEMKNSTTIGVNTVTGISAFKNEIEIAEPFPNPSKGTVCIPFETNYSFSVKIFLTDLIGNNILEIANETAGIGKNQYFINTSSMAPGIYLINYASSNGIKRKKLMVK